MKLEIYHKGKLLEEYDGMISGLTKYLGMNQKGEISEENLITLGIGSSMYWNCIVKMNESQTRRLIEMLEKLILHKDEESQTGDFVN